HEDRAQHPTSTPPHFVPMPRHTTTPTTQNPSRPKTTKTTRNERDRPLTTTNEHQNDDNHPYRSQTTASAHKRRGATTNTQNDT
ncbi:hypothetical protein K443DRAFT_67299, partial [Laccaria amethystina LaAM-08-1]